MTIVTTVRTGGDVDPASPRSGGTGHRTAGGAPARLGLRTGFELELLAPRGTSRADLAAEVAARCGGTVRRFFHTDSEPSLVPGMGWFIHLTPGFEVLGPDGAPRCRLVDDITLRADLDRRAPARPGWYRVLGDEPRLMRLVHRLADPQAPREAVLDPLAAVFGVAPRLAGDVVVVDDTAGATVAMAAPMPGERERACEVVTPPLTADHAAHLDALLAPARDLGFTVPVEAAVHLHVDAAPLRVPATFANLVRLFSAWREPLRAALRTNPACTRLAPLPDAVVAYAAGPLAPDWETLRAAVAPMGLKKYADVNLASLVTPRAEKDTVEIRCLPGMLGTEEVVAAAALVERLLARCRDPRPIGAPRPGARIEDVLGG
ncbi:amidoligase family protein [Kineosporia sp. R_H_3]|uniref:amidoligase family protein n=1 Tax=Kineosporia sp. R_H_3 TaxID=1961848 RepID=UPI0018E91C82|nr:amidoligase family protein [Kineosporia sp. R_H_3]